MKPHENRVIKEKEELDEKIKKLNLFFDSDIFITVDPEERKRLLLQYDAMNLYSYILEERIKNFICE